MRTQSKILSHEDAAHVKEWMVENDSITLEQDMDAYEVIEGSHPTYGQCTLVMCCVGSSLVIARKE